MPSCPSHRLACLLAATLLCGTLGWPDTYAQEAVENSAAMQISREQVQSKLAALESATELDEIQRGRIAESYRQTLMELDIKASLEASIAKLQQDIMDVPARLEVFRREIEAIGMAKVQLDPEISAAIAGLTASTQNAATWLELATQTLEQIESRRSEQQALLESARKSFASLQGEPKSRADRRVEIPSLILSTQNRIKALAAEAGASPKSDDLAQYVEARRVLLAARKANAELEIEAAKQELEFYDAAAVLLPIRVDAAQRKVSQLEQTVQLYSIEADRLRQNLNAFQTRLAASEALQQHAELTELAEEIVDLTAKRQDVGEAIQTTRQKLDTTVKLGTQLREQFERVQLQIGPATQVTESVGQILRKNRQDLPNVRKLRESSDARKTTIYDIRFALIDSEQQLWPLLDMDAKTKLELELLALEVPASRLQSLEPDLRELLQSKKSALDGLKTDLETYYRDLANLDFQEEQLITLTESYAEFIDQRVMWIRSVPRLAFSDIADTGNSIRWLLDTTSWTTLLKSFWGSGIRQYPFTNAMFVIVLLGLMGTRRPTRQRIKDLGESAESRVCCDIGITVQALFHSLVYTALWPTFFAWISWNLYKIGNGSELVRPLAIACGAVAMVIFPFELWRSILQPGGLAEAHFQWPKRRMQLVRRNLRWFMPSWILALFLFHVFHATENLVYEKSLARFLFLAAAFLLAVCVHRLVSPSSGFLKEYLVLNRGGWLDQLRWLWYPLLVSIPVIFAILAILGYQYTAAHLMRRFSISVALLSAIYIGSASGLRWIMLRRRAISIAHVRDRATDPQASEKERTQSTDSVGGVTLAENLDLSTVNAQSVRMLRSLGIAASLFGLYLVWASMMPALAQLDEVPLFPTSTGLQPSATVITTTPPLGAAPVQPLAPTASPIADYFAISLGQLLGAMAIVLVTFIAVQNIPGFMEIVLLQRLPLDASLRFAITTVTRYILVATGMVWALGSLGIGWGKIQWLVAGLSVGLGFGLQEIFANFVSGLILLFERPLRAGDIVTVGETSGKVVRINTRATTIRDWDRKELIVPNKDFITGKLLNWTLNDTTHRIVIRVGIAYGSDVKKAHAMLLEITERHPVVLEDPKPTVAMDAFGDSSLNMTLRCFLPNLDALFPVTHDLHETIHRELRAAGIEIAFPQRDLHIRSIDAPLRLRKSDSHELIDDVTTSDPNDADEG